MNLNSIQLPYMDMPCQILNWLANWVAVTYIVLFAIQRYVKYVYAITAQHKTHDYW